MFQLQMDKSKLADMRKKAIQSAMEFNSHFMRELKEERKAYFDLQTMVNKTMSKVREIPETNIFRVG